MFFDEFRSPSSGVAAESDWTVREQLSPVVLLLVALVGLVLTRGGPETAFDGSPSQTRWQAAGVEPAVTADEAVTSALNHLQAVDGGWRLEHPRHQAAFTAGGVSFRARQGPDWRWRLDSIASNQAPVAGVDHGPVLPVSENPSWVSYPRGSIEERYVVRKHGIEQQFILAEAPGLGGADLEVSGTVESSGAFEATSAGWLWGTGYGVVSRGDVRVFDGDGASIAARMQVAADRLQIVVDGPALDRAVYPVTIDPEIGTNDFRISEMGTDGDPSRDASEPAVAYNSAEGEYFVVWRGDGGGLADDDFQIFGQRIDGDTGLQIGPALRLSDLGVGGPGLGAADPAVAYNATDGEYLVVWSDDAGGLPGQYEIRGQRLDADPGSFGPVGADDFRISDLLGLGAGNRDFGAFEPAVAHNATDNEWFVVWHGDINAGALASGEHEIFGQRLDADPGSFGPVGSDDFRISDMGSIDGNRDFDAFHPAVVFNRLDREFLVVWEGDDDSSPLIEGESEVFGQRLDADPLSFGEVGGNDFRISDMGPDGNRDFGAFEPAVDHNHVDDEYLVVWRGDDQSFVLVDGEYEIFGQRLDAIGGEAGGNDFRISDMGPDGNRDFGAFLPAVAHNTIDNEYLVVWHGDDSGGRRSHTRGGGSLADNELEIFGQNLAAVGSQTGANDFRISDMGAADGDTAFDALHPATAYDVGRNRSLVVWHGDDDTGLLVDGEFEVYGQLLGAIADLEISKQAAPDPVVAGSALTYTLTVTNLGPNEAENVVVTDTLPAGVTLVSTSGCAEDPAGVPACGLGTIAPSSSKVATIVVTVDPAILGVITNTAVVTSDTEDPDLSDNSVSVDTVVIAVADLSLEKEDSQDPIAPGALLTYTLRVTNPGPSDATGVELTDSLPVGVTVISVSCTDQEPAGEVTCDLGTIAAGTTRKATIEVMVDPSTSGLIANFATLVSETPDPDLGNNSTTEFTQVDGTPPSVLRIDSIAGTGGGELAECKNTKAGLSRLLVAFSEVVRDPPGDTDPDDVTNPANYLLVASGPDQDFATSVCGPALGDDQVVAITDVTYDGAETTATLELAGGVLDDSLYRLLVCGSTTIRDPAGNPLDGDGDGSGGDDFVRTFRVDRANLFDNASFDCTIEDWFTVSTLPEEIEYSPEDVDDSLVSGSARVTNLSQSSSFSLGQCVAMPSTGYSLDGWIRVDTASGVVLSVSRVCEFFPLADCGGSSLGLAVTVGFFRDTAAAWKPLGSLGQTPEDTGSALCSYDLRTAGGDAFDAFLDSTSLSLVPAIFMDGFESGDWSAWSLTTGGD